MNFTQIGFRNLYVLSYFLKLSGCSPIKFWSMIRHGTRYPSDSIIRKINERLPLLRDEIIKLHQEGKGILSHITLCYTLLQNPQYRGEHSHLGSLCSNELRQLSKWSPQLEEEEEKKLTHEGEDELLLLGERFQKRFPHLLPEVYSNSSFKVRFYFNVCKYK